MLSLISLQIDMEWYWTKKYILENIKITWKIDDSRYGMVDLTEMTLDPAFVRFFRERSVSIKVDVPALSLPVHCDHKIKIHVRLGEPDPKSEYIVRVLPAVHISDEEFGIEFDDLLRTEGRLQQIYPGAADFAHDLQLHALDTCVIRLFVHVERLSDRAIFSHQAAYKISFEGHKETSSRPRAGGDNADQQDAASDVLEEVGHGVSEIDLES